MSDVTEAALEDAFVKIAEAKAAAAARGHRDLFVVMNKRLWRRMQLGRASSVRNAIRRQSRDRAERLKRMWR